MLHTDLIAVLVGGPMLFVVRRVGDQYQLVGEADVDTTLGFMCGKVIETMDRGELEAQYIEII
jgi:hypothetical protein